MKWGYTFFMHTIYLWLSLYEALCLTYSQPNWERFYRSPATAWIDTCVCCGEEEREIGMSPHNRVPQGQGRPGWHSVWISWVPPPSRPIGGRKDFSQSQGKMLICLRAGVFLSLSSLELTLYHSKSPGSHPKKNKHSILWLSVKSYCMEFRGRVAKFLFPFFFF